MPPVVQAYRGAEAWWKDATALRGMTAHHQELARVFARQWLDTLSPANFVASNPEVLQRTARALGRQLRRRRGHRAWTSGGCTRACRRCSRAEHAYQPGIEVAVTPGEVVHRNALVELIQYAPQTPKVHAEPVFIVPSWIMKYYVLDLSPHNSIVRWLVEQGHTVFIVSWRNPDEGDALLAMDDYLQLGVFDPLAAIARLLPRTRVHACGYCLGGTLLAIGAAALARPQRIERAELLAPLASLSLLAAETDFTEPGEMGVLIDESQVAMLEDHDGRTRLPQRAADGRQLPVPAFARAGVVGADARAAARRTAAPQRPDGLERRRHAHAGGDAQRVPAPLLPAQRAGRGSVSGGRPAGVAGRHPLGRSSRSAPRRTTSRPGARSTSCTA